MTVNAGARGADFAANGVTTSWPLNFQYLSSDDLVVTLIDADDVETVLSEGVGYTLTGSGPAGTGTLHRTPADATGNTIEVRRVTVLEQTTDFVANDNLPSASVEGALDRITLAMQEVADDVAQVAADQGGGDLEQAVEDAEAAAAAAAASAVTAGAAATSAASSYDAFDDRYLGAKAANPTLDNDGNALLTGALYFNTVGNDIRVWTGSSWATAYTAVTGYSAGSGIDITGTTISLLTEAVQDIVGAFLTASGSGLTVTYNDAGNAMTVALSTEAVQDIIGALIAAGTGMTVTYDDAGNAMSIGPTLATAAQFRANTADKVLATDKVWSAAGRVSLTDAATIAVDMSTFINATVTLTANRALGAPSNAKVGQSGVIEILQDGTGSRTLSYNAAWKFAGGSAPVLSTAAGSRDVLGYLVLPSGTIWAWLNKAIG